jgi:hypothetical protein
MASRFHCGSFVWVMLIQGCGVLAAAGPAWAQSDATLQGRVVAAANGSPVARATVTLRSARGSDVYEVATDVAGRFVFQAVRPGEYRLRAFAADFEPRELTVTLEPREIRIVTVTLALPAVQVRLDVAAEGLPASVHAPSSTLLTAERLADVPAFLQRSFTDAIVTLAPGMVRGHDDFVHIRGQEVALNPIVNGVSFWENAHALFSAGLAPLIIETANVLTGGFPAEYGNRFGGVVDIVTKSGFSLPYRGGVTATAGGAGRRHVVGEMGGGRGRVAGYLFGSFAESARFISPPEPRALHDRGREGHGFLQVDANLDSAGWLRALAMVDGSAFQIPQTARDLAIRPEARAEQRTRQQTALIGWSRAAEATAVNGTLYERWSRGHLRPAAGPLTARAHVDRRLVTMGGKLDVTGFARLHVIKAGVDVVRLRPVERLSYDYAGYRRLAHELGLPHIHIVDDRIEFDGRATGGQVSGYVQDTISLGRLTANVGVRVDRYRLVVTATHASPRVNLAWAAGRGAVLHGSYNRFFVPPPVEGVLSTSAGLTRRIREIGVSLPPLRPVIEDQIEGGLGLPVREWQLAVTAYARISEHPVHTTVWPDARVYSYANFRAGRANGLEVKLERSAARRSGLGGFVNYALARVWLSDPVTGGFVTEAHHLGATTRFPAPMDQTHTMTAGATWRPAARGFWMGARLEYGSGTPIELAMDDHGHGGAEADHDEPTSAAIGARVPSHTFVDVSAGWDLLRSNGRPRLTVRVDVENVAGPARLLAQESEFSPAQYSIPRLVSVTARVSF